MTKCDECGQVEGECACDTCPLCQKLNPLEDRSKCGCDLVAAVAKYLGDDWQETIERPFPARSSGGARGLHFTEDEWQVAYQWIQDHAFEIRKHKMNRTEIMKGD